MKRPTLSVASFNLFNLNKPGLPLHGGATGWTQPEYERKLDWTARNLSFLKSDIFGFQELWHADALADAVARAQLGNDYDVLVPPQTDGRGIVCAAIVAKGLLSGTPEWISAFPPKFKLASRGDDAQTPQIDVRISGFSRPVLHFQMSMSATSSRSGRPKSSARPGSTPTRTSTASTPTRSAPHSPPFAAAPRPPRCACC
jgi:hypothetical protein